MPALRRTAPTIGAAATLALAGCAGEPFSELARKAPSAPSLPLNGVYDATIQAPFSGALTARLYAQPTEQGFEARTREGVAWDLIGGVAGVLGPIVMPSLFPDGVILTWTSGLPTSGGTGAGSAGVAGLPSMRASTILRAAGTPVEIISRDGRRIGLMVVAPASLGPPHDTDYPLLATAITDAVSTRLYDRSLANSAGVRAYSQRLRMTSASTRDDIEFVFAAVLAARTHLKFTMPVMWRRGDPRLAPIFASWPERERATVRLDAVEAGTDGTSRAVIKADAFLDPAETDRVMLQAIRAAPDAMILDLRSSPGVTLASLLVAARLTDRPLDAGVFVGQRRRAEVLAGDSEHLPVVRVSSPQSIHDLEQALSHYDAARVVIEPAQERYAGPVYVAVSKRTSASAEPLVWILKASARAAIIGQPTAGKPLISTPIDLGQDWVLWLATYDYVPPEGIAARFNGSGIKPDIVVRDAMGEARRRAAAVRKPESR
jgi:hypothetical protein